MGRSRPGKSKPKRAPAKATEPQATPTPSSDAHDHEHNHDDHDHSHSASGNSSSPYQGACPSPGAITLANATGFIYKELSDGFVEGYLETTMDEELEESVRAKRTDGLGTALARWFRAVADREALKPGAERLLAWKKGAEYDPGNIFVRQSDTGRMLCMGLGPCRVRVYGTRSDFTKWDDSRKMKEQSMNYATAIILVAPLMAVRMFIDIGGADFPVIITRWPVDLMHEAMKYWVELSKGTWTESQRRKEFVRIHDSLHTANAYPCFHAVDHLVRALLIDPAADFIPLYILLFNPSAPPGGGSLFLFTDARAVPPASVIKDYPVICNGAFCSEDNGCGYVEMPKSGPNRAYVLERRKGGMVRESDDFHFIPTRKLCNLWGCNVQEDLLTCAKCKMVHYCSSTHQHSDWKLHKRICEKSST